MCRHYTRIVSCQLGRSQAHKVDETRSVYSRFTEKWIMRCEHTQSHTRARIYSKKEQLFFKNLLFPVGWVAVVLVVFVYFDIVRPHCDGWMRRQTMAFNTGARTWGDNVIVARQISHQSPPRHGWEKPIFADRFFKSVLAAARDGPPSVHYNLIDASLTIEWYHFDAISLRTKKKWKQKITTSWQSMRLVSVHRLSVCARRVSANNRWQKSSSVMKERKKEKLWAMHSLRARTHNDMKIVNISVVAALEHGNNPAVVWLDLGSFFHFVFVEFKLFGRPVRSCGDVGPYTQLIISIAWLGGRLASWRCEWVLPLAAHRTVDYWFQIIFGWPPICVDSSIFFRASDWWKIRHSHSWQLRWLLILRFQ